MNECDQELFPAWLPPYLILDPPPVLVVIDICRCVCVCVCVVFRWMSLQYWQAAAEKTANVLQKSCRLKNEKLHGDLISSSYHHRYAIGYMWNKLLQNYFSLRRRPSPDWNNFISTRGNLPEIISKLFHRVIAAVEYFPTCSMSLK